MTPSHSALKSTQPAQAGLLSVDICDKLAPADMSDLCDAAEAAIEAGGGFGWVVPPARAAMERYWNGVTAVPERHLLLARAGGVVCGAVQLVEPSRHNEAQSFMAGLVACFVAPQARRAGAASLMIQTAEKMAADMGYKVLQLDLRETQEAAIALFEKQGYARWGVNPQYAFVQGRMIAGLYYSKRIGG